MADPTGGTKDVKQPASTRRNSRQVHRPLQCWHQAAHAHPSLASSPPNPSPSRTQQFQHRDRSRSSTSGPAHRYIRGAAATAAHLRQQQRPRLTTSPRRASRGDPPSRRRLARGLRRWLCWPGGGVTLSRFLRRPASTLAATLAVAEAGGVQGRGRGGCAGQVWR